jgi:ribosome biogenesis protein Tsr3
VRRDRLALAVASAAFAVLAARAAWVDAPTYDEPTYVVSGLTALTRHDLRINPQHPPLAKVIAALPLLVSRTPVPRAGWRDGNEHRAAAGLVRAALRAGTLRRTILMARLASIVEAIAAAWVLAALADRLVGARSGWLPASLWLACPFVIGLGHLDGIDMPFALTALLGSLSVAQARRDRSSRSAVVVGVVAGVAVLTRVTGLLVLPAAMVAIAVADRRRGWRRASIVLLCAWGTVAAVYLLLAPAAAISHRPFPLAVVSTAANVAVPVAWRHGLVYLARAGSRPGPAFLLGHAHIGRWPLFWPVSVVLKLPPLTVVALVAGPVACLRLTAARRRELAWCVGLPASFLAVFAVQQQRPLGLRYLLPALALTWVTTAALVVRTDRRLPRLLAGVAVAGGTVACLAVPALAWTDPLAGPGYRVAADSNLDWGQGWWALRSWVAGRHAWVRYFGGAGLEVSALPGARDLRDAPGTVSGWVAVSASALTDYDRDELRWLRGYCPVGVLDRTILLYRFRVPVRTTGGASSSSPPRVCAGGTSRLVMASSQPVSPVGMPTVSAHPPGGTRA